MTQIKEKEWFAAHPHYKSIQQLCGIERLMESMISLLASKMIDEIPGLVNEMKKTKMEVRKEHDRSGAIRCSKFFRHSSLEATVPFGQRSNLVFFLVTSRWFIDCRSWS